MAYDLAKSKWLQEQLVEQGMIAFNPQVVVEASKYGIKFGTAEYMVYQYIRWCESPAAKYPIMIAGLGHIKERFGFDKEEDVRYVLNELMRKGAVQHILCNEKFYRAKTKAWVSTEKCKEFVGTPTKFVGTPTNASPVLPLGENNKEKKNNNTYKNNFGQSANASTSNAQSSDIPPSADASVAVATDDGFNKPSTTIVSADSTQHGEVGGVVKNTTLNSDPFAHDVDLKASVKKQNAKDRRGYAIGGHLLELVGQGNKKTGTKLKNLILEDLGRGYTERELIMAVKRGVQVDYYKQTGIFSMLSERGLDNLLNDKWFKAEMDKQKYDSIQSHLM